MALALKGADIICHPSNLVLPNCPDSMPVRCLENRVFAITSNRTGIEARHGKDGRTYTGSSKMLTPRGTILHRAPRDQEALCVVEIDPAEARDKSVTLYNDLLRDRREALYRLITVAVLDRSCASGIGRIRIILMQIPLKAQLGKGIFLVAAPNLRDPNFRQTVVLLCEHGAEGALGVVVNRPTAMSVSEALPQVPVLEGQRHVLFSGGPVQPNQVMLLYRLGARSSEV